MSPAFLPLFGSPPRRYEDDQQSAVSELLTMVVQCCGANDVVTSDMLDDIQSSCNSITQKHSNDDQIEKTYPLLEKNAKTKHFGRKFDGFIVSFIEYCESTALYDDYLIATLSSWLTAFSTSTVRSFRHTCTFAALRVGASLVQVYDELSRQEKDSVRQFKSESSKKDKRKSGAGPSQKLKSLQDMLTTLREQLATLWDSIENVYSGVIVHRYRDVSEQIRTIAVEALGEFICNLPEKMLDDKYLKYIGWSLNDKEATVRCAAVHALVTIYEVEGAAETLSLFTQRFQARLINMIEDSSPLVIAHTFKLMHKFADMLVLEADVLDNLWEMVVSNDTQVRRAAGLFFYQV